MYMCVNAGGVHPPKMAWEGWLGVWGRPRDMATDADSRRHTYPGWAESASVAM